MSESIQDVRRDCYGVPFKVTSVCDAEDMALSFVERAYACGQRDARGTCHIIKDFRPSSMTQATSTDRCSECGHVFGRSSRDEMLGICYQDYDAPYYCPHCGARVVYE